MTTKEYNDCVKQNSDDLYRFALRYTGDSATSKDAVQDCFVSLWEQRDGIETNTVKGWLLRVLYRRLVDRHRHIAIERNAMQAMAQEEIDNRQHLGFELHDAMQHALNQLPDIQRQLVLLKDLEGYDYKEMTSITGLTEQQVGVYLFRARKMLKEILIKQNDVITQ